ncbi:MAG: hypothetical protein AB9891_01690 [Anaerolineaceae bacterium]
MHEAWLSEIPLKYAVSGQDSSELFKALLAIAEEIGMETALAGLEECVFEKRRKWVENHPRYLSGGGDPVMQGYRMFYEHYLGLSLPRDGEVMESSEKKFTVRWRNRCPTLEACKKLGLDTRVVCRLAYERPAQMSAGEDRLKVEVCAQLRRHPAACGWVRGDD